MFNRKWSDENGIYGQGGYDPYGGDQEAEERDYTPEPWWVHDNAAAGHAYSCAYAGGGDCTCRKYDPNRDGEEDDADPREGRTDPREGRTYRVANEEATDEDLPWAPGPTILLTWSELAAVNDPETMDEIDRLAVGESTILGMCDPIERLS